MTVDWKTAHADTAPAALALWQQIAPTGDDYEERLSEIPGDQPVAHELAVAFLLAGNVTCAPAPAVATACGKQVLDVPAPAPGAALADPCLRRLVALWAIDQLDADDLPAVRDALRAIAAIPPPESLLVAAAIGALPELDHDGRLELLGIAWRAGQHELVNGRLGSLDEPHLIDAAARLHIDGALEVLSAEGQRPAYLAALADPQMAPAARVQAIAEVIAADELARAATPAARALRATRPTETGSTSHPGRAAPLAPDLRAALVTAAGATDCMVAAAAARALGDHDDPRFVPRRLRGHTPAALLRDLCVLAAYQQLQGNDEPSLLAGYLPARGLVVARVTFDPYSDVDADGDGDLHTQHTAELVGRAHAVLPEVEDLARALRGCVAGATGASCQSDDHDYRLTWKPGAGGELVLVRLEIADRPACP